MVVSLGPTDAGCEDPEPEAPQVTFTMGGGVGDAFSFAPGETLTLVASDATEAPQSFATYDLATGQIIKPESKPSLLELLDTAGSEDVSLVEATLAAKEAAWQLKQQLERELREAFPDFYWNADDLGELPELYFPRAKKWKDLDDTLTPERDKRLRELGFTHLNRQRLGLVTA